MTQREGNGQRNSTKRLIGSKKLNLPEEATPEEVFKLLLRHYKKILAQEMDSEFRFNVVIPAVLKTLSMVKLQLDEEDQKSLKEMLEKVHRVTGIPPGASNVRTLPRS